jgi:hypothetical protein
MDGALLMPNVEENEQAMDAQWATASARHRGDPYDAEHSDDRYEQTDLDRMSEETELHRRDT